MSAPAKYALTTDQQRAEMGAITECWKLLSPLDTGARTRVLRWLGSWVNQEAPKGCA